MIRRCGRAWLACLLLTSLVHAQQASESVSARAEALFNAGIALAGEERYAEAAEKFKQSYAAEPTRGTLLALALAEEKSGKFAAAFTHYQALLAEAREAGDRERERAAAPKLDELRTRIAQLTIVTLGVPAGAELRVDDEVVPLGIGRVVVVVDPGAHAVLARTADGAKFERDVALVAGAALTVEVKLAKPTTQPVRPTPTPKKPPTVQRRVPPPRENSALATVGWIGIGVGAVTLGGGSYLWLRSGAIYDEVVEACKTDAHCASSQRERADQGQKMENWARVLLIGGGVIAATGITLLVLAPSGEKSKSARLVLSGHGASVYAGF